MQNPISTQINAIFPMSCAPTNMHSAAGMVRRSSRYDIPSIGACGQFTSPSRPDTAQQTRVLPKHASSGKVDFIILVSVTSMRYYATTSKLLIVHRSPSCWEIASH